MTEEGGASFEILSLFHYALNDITGSDAKRLDNHERQRVP